jgi:2-polyprenyl-3-methyl-5-hydroxy-6-metoxy-1,4-benzoquinol methylase
MVSVETLSGQDKAGTRYWDQLYTTDRKVRAIDPHDTSLRNYVACQFHRYFVRHLSAMESKQLLEVGCGGSQYLPYFAKEFGLQVTGLDYSEPGCKSAARLLATEGITGNIVCANMFEPPPSLRRKFDVVVSMGVVEHFVDTPACIAAISNLVKPGGLVLTFTPNMYGFMGTLQKLFDRELFDKHVPLSRELLRRAHEKAGLSVLECDYFLSNNFFVVGLPPRLQSSIGEKVKKLLMRCLHYISGAVWMLETSFHTFRPSKMMSPYIVCAARTSPVLESTSQN